MNALIFNSYAAAQVSQSFIDNALGYPKNPSDVISGLFPMSGTFGITTHYQAIIPNVSGTSWALGVDANTLNVLSPTQQAQLSTMDASFIPVDPKGSISQSL